MGFSIFAGPSVLDPTNIAWLASGDRAMHTLGWLFFRHGVWGLPPGVSPDYGLELGNTIALVDGLPLLALPFKLASPLLPEPFQYWGLWMLLCFVLQAIFGYAIARALGVGRVLGLVAAGFVIIAPVFLFRLPLHMALGGHWTILAALWLYVRRDPPPRYAWPLLAVLTAAIHVYLLAMVLGLWVAALMQRMWLRRLSRAAALAEIAAVGVGVVAMFWLVGLLVTGTLGTYGFGSYRLNLFGPFTAYGWSALMPELPHTKYDYEGLSFLGIGVFVLLGLAIVSGGAARLQALRQRRWLPLVVVVALFTLFAFSNKIVFGNIELFSIPLPDAAQSFAAMFRSSGRFVWPAVYLLSIGAVVLVGQRFRPRVAIPLVLAALALQIADSSAGWRGFATRLPPPATHWATTMVSPLWEGLAAAGYSRIRAVPVVEKNPDWKDLSYFAATHHMGVDAVYLGRVDAAALDGLRLEALKALVSGDFEPATLYVLDPAAALWVTALVTPADLFVAIDGRLVFARGGADIARRLGLDPHSAING